MVATINSKLINNVGTFGSLIGLSGTIAGALAIYDLILTCRTDDQRQITELQSRAWKKMAFAVGAYAIWFGIEYWTSIKKQEMNEILQLLMTEKQFESLTGSLPEESTICNIDALKQILSVNGQPNNNALFKAVDCKTFLPWNKEFGGSFRGLNSLYFNQPEMWGITPSKNPFITMASNVIFESQVTIPQAKPLVVIGQKEHIFGMRDEVVTLVFENNTFTAFCRAAVDSSDTNMEIRFSQLTPPKNDGKLLDGSFIDVLFNGLGCPDLKERYLSLVGRVAIYSNV